MNSMTVALISFACMFSGALIGWFLCYLVPNHHMSEKERDVVKLSAGLIATLAALVLGLLVSTAKNSLDTMNSELIQNSAKIIMLDRTLNQYGPETKDIHDILRRNIATVLDRIWPEDKSKKVHVENNDVTYGMERIQLKLRNLVPNSDSQRYLQSQAQQLVSDLAQTRWLIIEQSQQKLPTVFIIILIFWLTMLFVSFGLLAPHNPTIIAVLLICSLSVSGAVLLILEMNNPLDGMIKVSSAPFRNAFDRINK